MGPERNKELFDAVAGSRIQSLTQEFVRRNLLAATLKEISELFADKDHTSHPVTEPTLLGRLWALTQVQRTHLGIAGFDPLEAVDFDGSIIAKSAPHHHEFSAPGNNTICTRIISLTMPDTADTVEIFGLNLYQPDVDTDEFFGDPENGTNKLVIVGDTGRIRDKIYPITGETVAFAVRNKQTQDAKLYRVAYTDPAEALTDTDAGIKHEGENRIIVSLPDEMAVVVELIDGQLQHQMVDELRAAIDKLKSMKVSELAADERQAVSEIFT